MSGFFALLEVFFAVEEIREQEIEDKGDGDGGARLGEDVSVACVEGRAPLVYRDVVGLAGTHERRAVVLVVDDAEDGSVWRDEACVGVVSGAEERAAVLDGAEDGVAEMLLCA